MRRKRKKKFGSTQDLKKRNVLKDQMITGQPKSTEEVEVGKNTKYTMGEPGVIVMEDSKLRKGQPNSSKEVEDEKEKKKKKKK